jgi:hypothetical protein
MQIKNGVLVLAILLLQTEVWSDEPQARKTARKLASESGLFEGQYYIDSGSEDCPQGDLEYLENDGKVTIMMGDRVLMISPDLESSVIKEEDCTISTVSKITNGNIAYVFKQTCKDSVFEKKINMGINNGRIDYSEERFLDGNLEKARKCVLLEGKPKSDKDKDKSKSKAK